MTARGMRLSSILHTLYSSYRQVDYWIIKGFLPDSFAGSGSGHTRFIDMGDYQTLWVMDRLVHAGISPPEAAPLARLFVDNPSASVVLSGAVRIQIDWSSIGKPVLGE